LPVRSGAARHRSSCAARRSPPGAQPARPRL